ncbi:MAG: dockerin type I domain-containing protein [Pirellulaceae bacterium]
MRRGRFQNCSGSRGGQLREQGRGRWPRRKLAVESLESRRLLAVDVAAVAELFSMDVNIDGEVSPIDALLVINHLNANAAGPLAGAPAVLDVNGDGEISPNDVQRVVNRLNLQGAGRIGALDILGDQSLSLTEAQRSALDQLMTDLNSLRAEFDITASTVASMVGNFSDLFESATAPSATAVTTLFTRFENATSDGQISIFEFLQLSGDVNAVLSSAGLSQQQIQETLGSLTSLIQDSGVSLDDFGVILDDVRVLFESFAPPEQQG